jgi:hypothetical protein
VAPFVPWALALAPRPNVWQTAPELDRMQPDGVFHNCSSYFPFSARMFIECLPIGINTEPVGEDGQAVAHRSRSLDYSDRFGVRCRRHSIRPFRLWRSSGSRLANPSASPVAKALRFFSTGTDGGGISSPERSSFRSRLLSGCFFLSS